VSAPPAWLARLVTPAAELVATLGSTSARLAPAGGNRTAGLLLLLLVLLGATLLLLLCMLGCTGPRPPSKLWGAAS
jgi:hypothetical protein